MVLAYVFGISLIGTGLFLLCHHGYTQMNLVGGDKQADDVECSNGTNPNPKANNDCCVPICFFQVSQIYNHETWIVVSLLCGSTILLMSLNWPI
jgi:hypothetical protein